MERIFILATLLAAVASPLLTFASLWQIKEWRIDRLREHFRAEGFWRQVKGIVRPVIIAAGIIITMFPPTMPYAGESTLLALAVVSIAQMASRKQRYPVWTGKAIVILFLALCIDLVVAAVLIREIPLAALALSVLVLFQPDAVLLSWLMVLPLDAVLKRRTIRRATALCRMYEHATVIGITGSVGKTTTKELIAQTLRGKNILATPAYVNSEMGIAQWILRELPKHAHDLDLVLIVEMGAYRAGEIRTLCEIVKPSMGVITFIGTQHIALFGSQEKLCDAKAELLESLPEDGHAFLNGDNTACGSLRKRCRCAVTTVGTGGHADLEAFDIEETGAGIRFRVGETAFTVPLHGTHNVVNVLLATAVAKALGVERREIAEKLRSFQPPSSTFALRTEHGVTVLDDTHNASPESFRAAIAWAKAQPMERKILVTPGLIELGADSGRIHRELGEQAQATFHRVIFTQQQGRSDFALGFQSPTELLSTKTSRIKRDDLLVCVGRFPQEVINRILPTS